MAGNTDKSGIITIKIKPNPVEIDQTVDSHIGIADRKLIIGRIGRIMRRGDVIVGTTRLELFVIPGKTVSRLILQVSAQHQAMMWSQSRHIGSTIESKDRPEIPPEWGSHR